MAFTDSIYQSSPAWLQTALLNTYALRLHGERFGRRLHTILAEWDESQWWSSEKLREEQSRKLRALVRFASERVPFYGRLWAEHGVNPGQVQNVSDIVKLPTITKQDVRAAGNSLLSRTSRGLIHGHTSGTTGTPLNLWYDSEMVIANNAADCRTKKWGMHELGDWSAMFLGRIVVPANQRRPPFWRANFIQKQLWCSSFHLAEQNIPTYISEIRGRGIQSLEGYPSTMFILARHLLRNSQTLPMRAVFTSSETLHLAQREALESAFQCPVFDFYGMAERVIFAAECGRHGGKHLFDEYGITELLDDDGNPVPDGTSGTMTGTSLWNRAMPLIRYRTGDVSVRDPRLCECGRGLGRLADVSTKAEDIVITPDGRFVSPSVLTHPFKPFDQLLKSQVIQDAPDHILVKLVPSAGFTDAHRATLRAGLQARLGSGMRIETEIVEDIPPESSGKYRWVVCKVPHACKIDW